MLLLEITSNSRWFKCQL